MEKRKTERRKKTETTPVHAVAPSFLISEKRLFHDVCSIVESARREVASSVNAGIVMMYWSVGARVNHDVLGGKRAVYGQRVVEELSRSLCVRFSSREFNVRNLRRMMQFAQEFPDSEIVSRAATQLSWSHVVEILPLKDSLRWEFYLTMAGAENWSRYELRAKIDGMLFERTTISGKPDEFVRQELAKMQRREGTHPDLVFKNPDREELRAMLQRQLSSARLRMGAFPRADPQPAPPHRSGTPPGDVVE